MRIILVSLFVLASFHRARADRRVEGRGFTISLPDAWEVVAVNDQQSLKAHLQPNVSLTVLPAKLGVTDAKDCKVWASELADDFNGAVKGAVFQRTPIGRLCRYRIRTKAMVIYRVIRDSKSPHLVTCVALPEAEHLAIVACEGALATWTDEPKAKPLALARRVEIDRNDARTIVRGASFMAVFLPEWQVSETAGTTFVSATTRDAQIGLGETPSSLDGVDEESCKAIARDLKSTAKNGDLQVVSSRFEIVSGQHLCRIEQRLGEVIGWSAYRWAGDHRLAWFRCTNINGSPGAACDKPFDSWTRN